MKARRRHTLRWLAALPLAAGLPGVRASALPPEVEQALPGAKLQGSGTLRFFGMRIYDARLWAPVRIGDDWTATPLALELEYHRHLDGAKIAERSIEEMRRQADFGNGPADRWLAAMKQAFPDVRAGDRLTGLLQPGTGVRWFFNGTPRGELRDAEFAKLFIGIWLSPRTSEPALRSALLGGAK
jgi:hypothetical protein